MESARDVVANLFQVHSHAVCEVCGNQYDEAFEVRLKGKTHVFDSFECAIQALAPTCAHCGCRIIGHGMQAGGAFYCCAHCAGEHGIHDLADRAMPEREGTPT